MKLKYVLTFLALFFVCLDNDVQSGPIHLPAKSIFQKRLKDGGFDVGITVEYLSSRWHLDGRVDAQSSEVYPHDVALAVVNLIDYHRFNDDDITVFFFLKSNRCELIKNILQDFHEEQNEAIEILLDIYGDLFT